MQFRKIALALALGCGLMAGVAEAKKNPHSTPPRVNKKYKGKRVKTKQHKAVKHG
jgi:hypothetical protein